MSNNNAGQKGLGIALKPDVSETAGYRLLGFKNRRFSSLCLSSINRLLIASLFILTPLAAQAATLQFDPSITSYDENAGIITLSVRLTAGLEDTGSCSVSGNIETLGTATLGTDYYIGGGEGGARDGSFAIEATFFGGGEFDAGNTDTVTITIADDSLIEDPETIIVSIPTITHECNLSIDNLAARTLTIVDDDELPLPSTPSLSETQQAVDDALASLCGTTESQALQTQCDILDALPAENLGAALQQIAPDEVMAQGKHSVKIASTQLGNVKTRLLALRNNKKSNVMLAFNDFSMSVNGETLPTNMLLASVMSDAGSDGLVSDSLSYQGKLAMFINGRINYGDKETTSRESGFDFNTNGITFGADYRLTDQLILGGALGYANTDSDFNEGGGNLDTRALSFTLYGSLYTPKDYYLDWLLNWGANDFDTTRNIIYSGTSARAEGSTEGTQLGVSVNAGTSINFGSLLINPYARLEYIQSEIDAYQETGGAGLALAIADQSVDSLTTALAARVSMAISQNWGVLTPSTYLEWEHEYENGERLITSRFVEDPSVAFSIPGDNRDKDYFNLGVALSAMFTNGRSAFVNYEAVLGLDDINSYTVDFGVRVAF